MKEIVVPCYINGRLSTHKLYVGDGCRDDKGPVDAQVAWCANRSITFGPDLLKNITALRDLARKKNVSFEELIVLAYVVANKKLSQKHEEQIEFDAEREGWDGKFNEGGGENTDD